MPVWGVAVELTTKPLDLVAEVFGQNSEERLVSIGFVWYGPPILP